MTRAPKATERPLVRTVTGVEGDLVIGINQLGVTIRPKRARNPEAVVFVPWDAAYQRALLARVARPTRAGKRSVKRGKL